jgi:Protein of unknown function (DUF2911)
MIKILMTKIVCLSIVLFLFISVAYSQEKTIIKPKDRQSPIALATFKNANLYVKVTYGQPSRKNRDIFGKVVPYGEVWRTGANEATEIFLTKDMKIGTQVLKKGMYTIFSIPNEKEWTIIFNNEIGLFGAFDYETIKDKNALVINTIPVEKLEDEIYDTFMIILEETSKGFNMLFCWEDVKVVLPMEIK